MKPQKSGWLGRLSADKGTPISWGRCFPSSYHNGARLVRMTLLQVNCSADWRIFVSAKRGLIGDTGRTPNTRSGPGWTLVGYDRNGATDTE